MLRQHTLYGVDDTWIPKDLSALLSLFTLGTQVKPSFSLESVQQEDVEGDIDEVKSNTKTSMYQNLETARGTRRRRKRRRRRRRRRRRAGQGETTD